MKKKILILAAVMLISLLAACAKPTAQPQPVNNEKNEKNNEEAIDVLVVGGGGAGMVAGITAAENGSKVIIVEKMPMLGGNTIISATGITASDTDLHKQAGIPFTVEDHIKKTMETGKNLPDEKLVRILAESSNDAYQWLVSLGLKYKLDEKEPWWIIPVEGHYGRQLFDAYNKKVEELGDKIEIRLDTKATELIVEGDKVVGAKVVGKDGKEIIIKANAVVLATGGFGNAPELIGEYNPKYAGAHNIMSTAGPTGEGFKMAVAVGAGTRDMEHHQMRPLATPGYWIRETVINEEGLGGILVNASAVRFTNETLKPLELVPEILKQQDRIAYVVFDSEVAATKNGTSAIKNGKMIEAATIEELAEKLGLDAAKLRETVDKYNEGTDEFGRSTMGKVTVGPFYGVKVAPSSHYTMAGITINENAQVTNEAGEPIPGLYAAGEVVGGLYGAGRIAGNNTLDDIVFGKIAGKNASVK